MKERRDSGLEGFKIRGIPERRDTGKEECRSGGMQDWKVQEWRNAG